MWCGVVWPGRGRKPARGESTRRAHRSTASLLDVQTIVQSKAEHGGAQGSDQSEGRRGVSVGGRGQVHRDRPEGGQPGLPSDRGPRPSLRPRRPALAPQVLGGDVGGREVPPVWGGLGRARVTGAPAGNETALEVVPGHLTAPSFCSSLLPLKSSPFFFLEDTPLPLPGPPVPTDGAGDPAWRRAVGDGALLAGPAPSGGTWEVQCDSLLSALAPARPARPHAARPARPPAKEGGTVGVFLLSSGGARSSPPSASGTRAGCPSRGQDGAGDHFLVH